MTLDDLRLMAYRVAALPKPTRTSMFGSATGNPDPDAAIFKYWSSHKEVGLPYTREYRLDDDSVGVITATGRILHWLGGDQVEVL